MIILLKTLLLIPFNHVAFSKHIQKDRLHPIRTIRNSFPPPTTTIPTTTTPCQNFPGSQTAEPIVKYHTILEMGSHDLLPHTFVSGL